MSSSNIAGPSFPEQPGAQYANQAGLNIFWTIFGIMAAGFLLNMFLTIKTEGTKRFYHYLTTAITFISMLAYYGMASNEGWTLVPEFNYRSSLRQVFWARYIDWTLTTPLLLINLCLVAGLPWDKILWTAFLAVVMSVTGLLAALDSTPHKWGWYVFGLLAFIPIIITIAIEGRKTVSKRTPEQKRIFSTLSAIMLLVWIQYPIVWVLSEGTSTIPMTAEIAWYGTLDVIAKVGFGLVLLTSHNKLEPPVFSKV